MPCYGLCYAGAARVMNTNALLLSASPAAWRGLQGFGDRYRAADLVNQLPDAPSPVAVFEQQVEDVPVGFGGASRFRRCPGAVRSGQHGHWASC
jgi:hypothetical protein